MRKFMLLLIGLAFVITPVMAQASDFARIIGGVDTPGNSKGISISGNHAFVADMVAGLQIIDISDPATTLIVGSVDTPNHARGVSISGAYVLFFLW